MTPKKLKYLEEEIIDANGKFSFISDPEEYKRARKRLQNRESAVRSRLKRKTVVEELQERVEQLEALTRKLSEENCGLKKENGSLQKQLTFFEDNFAKSSLVGYEGRNRLSQPTQNPLVQDYQRHLLQQLGLDEESIDTSSSEEPRADSGEMQTEEDTMSESSQKMMSYKRRQYTNNIGYMFLAIVFCMLFCTSLVVKA